MSGATSRAIGGAAPRPLWKRLLRRPFMTVRRAAEIGFGALYVSSPWQALRTFRLGARPAPKAIRAALLAHVYYPDLWPDIRALHATLPAGSPLIVTAPTEQAAAIAALAAGDPLVEIVAVTNRGRDIAPFLQVLNAGLLDRFDAVLKVHTKKSPHLRGGELRRRVLFAALAGSCAVTASALRRFEDPRTGMVGAGSFFRTAPAYWMDNRGRVEALAARIGAQPTLGFFEGSMFWVRPAALWPFRALGLRADHFEQEAGQLDGTLHHAIERLFPIAATAMGFETRSLTGAVLVGSDLPTLDEMLSELATPLAHLARLGDASMIGPSGPRPA